MAATTALREALNQGISSGDFIDTKIILYSHKDTHGRVCRPKPLYANSHVLKTVPYFNDLLFGNFAESRSQDFNKEAVDDEESADDYGYLSDSDLEDDEDEKAASPKQKTRLKTHALGPFADLGREENLICEEHEERVDKGKVVKIPDMAFVTFQAFLMYLYTNVIEFAPFGSQENRRSRSANLVSPSDDGVPKPSPKSIYRLADKYDVPALKTLALDHIRGQLAKCDIVEEAFSRFASRHDEIRNLYIEQLAHMWVEDSATDKTRASVEKKIDDFVEEGFKHATEMLSALWEIVNKEGDVIAPADPSPTITQITSPAHWAAVKTALIKSIRRGVFFDRKYWARHSKAGDVLKPIYFSSVIMEDKSSQLSKLVKSLKGRNIVINDPNGNLNVESDCEGDPTGAGLETSERGGEKEKTRAVLITGSFSAWKSLFFYRCTDVILFAPLKSQGVDSRSQYISDNTVEDAPPPCSPKSIYVLACLLEIDPLRDSAFADIKTKVTVDNVVSEVFSWVPSSHSEITEMQCALLMSNSRDPNTITLVKENIGHIFDGSLPHCADSLKLGLKKAFELKRQERRPLRCSNGYCAGHNNYISCSSAAANSCCAYCGHWMQCVACGYNRCGNYASCQGCGKRFL